MKKIKVSLKKQIDDSYNLLLGTKLNLAREIKKLSLNNHYAIITDDKVYKLYSAYIKEKFDKEKLNYNFIVFRNGEKFKNLRVLSYLSEQMLKLNYDRKSTIIALGGGVTGDMAGYVAGTFMRGIPFVQIPTTLLAQVDSSIGGKVAVDLKMGKNSSGLFYQPKKVIIDTFFLNTLTEDEFANGMFEIIKHAIIRSQSYFDFLVQNEKKIKQRQSKILVDMIYQSCKIKADVVMRDEKENNLRRILNFGHSCGHAFETLSRYKIKHGFAVGLGMMRVAQLAYSLNLLKMREAEKIRKILQTWGVRERKISLKKMLNVMAHDKKNIYSGKTKKLEVPIVLPQKIGKVVIKNFTMEDLKKLMV